MVNQWRLRAVSYSSFWRLVLQPFPTKLAYLTQWSAIALDLWLNWVLKRPKAAPASTNYASSAYQVIQLDALELWMQILSHEMKWLQGFNSCGTTWGPENLCLWALFCNAPPNKLHYIKFLFGWASGCALPYKSCGFFLSESQLHHLHARTLRLECTRWASAGSQGTAPSPTAQTWGFKDSSTKPWVSHKFENGSRAEIFISHYNSCRFLQFKKHPIFYTGLKKWFVSWSHHEGSTTGGIWSPQTTCWTFMRATKKRYVTGDYKEWAPSGYQWILESIIKGPHWNTADSRYWHLCNGNRDEYEGHL